MYKIPRNMGKNNIHIMKKLYLNPIFIFGMIIRLIIISAVEPLAISNWFAPFMNISTSIVTLDPWEAWISSGGTSAAFPYGYIMWAFLLPITIITKIFGGSIEYAYNINILIADLCLLVVIDKLVPNRQKIILIAYWLSPIVILASYALGLNDLIPTLILALAFLSIKKIKVKTSAALLAAAISAKLSMIIALPFFAIYMINNKALKQLLPKFILAFTACALLLGLPFYLSKPAVHMLTSNPEIGKIYQLTVTLTGYISIYIVPLAYLVMLYLVWRVRRFNYSLFQTLTGITLLLIALMVPASPGWFVWCIPALAVYQANSGKITAILVSLCSCLYIATTLLVTPIQFDNGKAFELGKIIYNSSATESHTASLIHTAMLAIGIVLAIRIWHESVSRNDFFRLTRKPFVIGIAGDSATGKDRFSNNIEMLFGKHSIAKISGDDYHLWDRQKPMWGVITHLNPIANNLEAFFNDIVNLINGKNIFVRHYDHAKGKMGKPAKVKSNDFLIASGLHALYLPSLRECYNLKIYLDTNENLREYFKVKRDTIQRGHSLQSVIKSLKIRKPDAKKFIHPQSKHADLIFSLNTSENHTINYQSEKHELRLKLIVITKHEFNEILLNRVLVGLCGLYVEIITMPENNRVKMTIEGNVDADDIKMAANTLCPKTIEFLDISPKWHNGMDGIMQLITLSRIEQIFKQRLI